MRTALTAFCKPLGSGTQSWERNGKGLWKCLGCGRSGLQIRQRHLSWPEPIQIPVYGERRGSRNEVVAHALVSPIDAHLLQYKWRVTLDGYVYRPSSIARKGTFSKGVNRYLHREILGLEPGNPLEGHHVNDLPLDCRRGNLEVVTRSQNELLKHHRNVKIRRFRAVVPPTPLVAE